MKKIRILFLIVLLCTAVTVYAIKNDFKFDTSNLSFISGGKKQSVINNFNSEYNLTKSINSNDTELEETIKDLTKKTTYLLFGKINNINESNEEYYQRHREFMNLKYNPVIPKDDSTYSGYDENSDEYKDSLVASFTLSNIFIQASELGMIYNSYGDIRITTTDKFVISSIVLPNVKVNEQDEDNPMVYNQTETNFVMYYFYKKLGNEYKLYYLFGKSEDDVSDYLSNVEGSEAKNAMAINSTYDPELEKIYNFDKLKALTEAEINSVYTSNSQNIVYLSSFYNNNLIASANGFFITDGLIITTWSFLEKSLINSQYILVKNSQQKSIELAGIVTANPETNVAVIKVKERNNSEVKLLEDGKVNIEDPVIAISSKSGVGLTAQKGIILSTDNYLQTSIPLSTTDEGSPLFNKDGYVIGMNNPTSVGSSTSIAINVEILQEIKQKFKNIAFEKIESIAFEKLKENYYYLKYNEENIKNDIPNNIWKKYSKIGKIEESIKLELIKSSYQNKVLSLRYKNNISKYIESMLLATEFKENLIAEGYTEVLNTKTKAIYKNKEYQVVIMEEFDYLIVIMVKL